MRVAFVDTLLMTPPLGGAHTFLISLTDALTRRGWEIHVVTQTGSVTEVRDAIRTAGGQVHESLWSRSLIPEERAQRLARWVREAAPEVYVVSNSGDTGWLTLPLLPREVATASIAHNDVPGFYIPLQHYGDLIDCAIGVSEETTRKLVEVGGMPESRACQVPYGVETLPRGEAQGRWETVRQAEPLRIVYVGRVDQKQKRVMDLPPLFQRLSAASVPFELHVIGDGPARPELEEILTRQQGDRVHFYGWLPRPEVQKRLAEMDVILLVSDYEGLPVALLEGMGQALAPVVSNIPSGNSQLVRDGVNGFLPDVGALDVFAARLAALAADRALLSRMKQLAWETSQDYTIERMADRYAECFQRITAPAFNRSHRPVPGPFPVMPSCRSRYPAWLRKLKQRLVALSGA